MPYAIISQPRTILGPLTSTFTPQPSCSSVFRNCITCDIGWQAQTCVETGIQDNPSCWPPTSNGVPSPSPTLTGWGFYSPGVVCPEGYTSACTATAEGTSQWLVQFSMTAGETAVGCCPSGYNCTNVNGGTCALVATSTIVPVMTCANGLSGGVSEWAILPTELSHTSQYSVYAPLFQINWHASDRPVDAIATTTPGSSLKGTKTASSPSPSQTASDTEGSSNSHGNDSDITVGSVVGSVLGSIGGLCLIAIALRFLVPWIKKRRVRPATPPQTSPQPPPQVPEQSPPENLSPIVPEIELTPISLEASRGSLLSPSSHPPTRTATPSMTEEGSMGRPRSRSSAPSSISTWGGSRGSNPSSVRLEGIH